MISTIRHSNAGNASSYSPSSDGENFFVNGNLESNPNYNGIWSAVHDRQMETLC